jgi:branched-chain amino acid transport system permease protein
MIRFLSRYRAPLILLAALPLTWALPRYGIINPYLELILKYIGINIILTVSLNLVNGYLGEFSVGHAGFMAIGAYAAAVCTVALFPRAAGPLLFPLALLIGGVAAGCAGVLLAFPSFRTRGDYLAIVTLAFNMIVRSALENIEPLGGARGYMGMEKLSSLTWVFVCVVLTVYAARNFVYSRFGRGVQSVREDEVAADLVGVDTRQVKVLTFVFSAFLAGVAGGLFAHVLQFINPRSFTILKSTEMLVMVYLGGAGSLGGSLIGGTLFTVVYEALRPLQEWRAVLVPLLLVLLMLFRPRGIMGGREFSWLRPRDAAGAPSTTPAVPVAAEQEAPA